MKQLFVLGILIMAMGGPHSAFAKAQQPSITDAIYQRLDTYREAPNSSNAQAFYQWLQEQSIVSKEEQLAKVISLCNLGYFERNRASETAIRYYAEGWNIYNSNQLSGFDILDSCLKPLGNLYTQTNALTEAQQIIELYIFKAQEAGRADIIPGGIANLSVVHQNQGNNEKAITILQEGLKRHPNHPDLLTNLATNLLAVNRYQEGLAIAQQSLAAHPYQPNIYKMRAQLYTHTGRYPEAIVELEQAFLLQKQNPKTRPREMAKTSVSLAEIYVKQDDLTSAKQALKQAYTLVFQNNALPFDIARDFPENRQLFAENTLMDALDVQAHIATVENNYELGLELYQQAAYIGDLLQATQRDQQSRLIMQSNSKRRVASYLDLAYETYKTTQDRTLLDSAFVMTQKATASIVSETYIDKKQRLPYRTDALVIDLEQREKKQANWRVEVYENQKQGIPDLRQYAAILDSIDQNGYHIKKILEGLRTKFPDLKGSTATSLSEVQTKAKQKGQTVVSYFMGAQATYQFVISGSDIAFHRLTQTPQEQEEFKQACIEFIGYFKDAGQINNDPNGYAMVASLLYESLQLPKAEQLIIIPDSFLQFVPFDALLTQKTKGFNYQEMPFLMKETAVSYALSPLLYMQEDSAMKKNPSVLGVFPVFENTPLELTYSVGEAKALKDHFDGVVLMHMEASTAAAFAKAGDHQILHFSTHASGGSFQTPAYLQLYDAQVPVNQLYGDQWQSDLVVLSACETGIGAIISGEGAQSLARGFQYAGVQNIAFTLWQVNDKATATLMSSYYENLKKTSSRNGSLVTAKMDYLENQSIPNTKKSPYYWAAFVYYGTTDVSSTSNSWFWWVGLGIFVLFLGFLLKRKHGITA